MVSPIAASTGIDIYISKLPEWQQEICNKIRQIILNTNPDIKEVKKWNSPAAMYDFDLLCFYWASKDFIKLTFHKGALIADKYNMLEDKSNQRNRSIRFRQGDEVDPEKLSYYIKAGIQLIEDKHK